MSDQPESEENTQFSDSPTQDGAISDDELAMLFGDSDELFGDEPTPNLFGDSPFISASQEDSAPKEEAEEKTLSQAEIDALLASFGGSDD